MQFHMMLVIKELKMVSGHLHNFMNPLLEGTELFSFYFAMHHIQTCFAAPLPHVVITLVIPTLDQPF